MPRILLGQTVTFRLASGFRQADEVVARTTCETCSRPVLLTHGWHTLEADGTAVHPHPGLARPA
jgi:hypothetical protein